MMIQLTSPANLIPKGFQQLTDITAAAGLTVPSGATVALLQAEGDNVRWRDDGINPTTSVGILLIADVNQPYMYQGDLSALKFIETGTDAVLNVVYYAQVP